MYVLNIKDDYNSFIIYTVIENEDNKIIFKYLLLLFPSGILLLNANKMEIMDNS